MTGGRMVLEAGDLRWIPDVRGQPTFGLLRIAHVQGHDADPVRAARRIFGEREDLLGHLLGHGGRTPAPASHGS
jgi:hypothetical protein